MGQVGFFGKLPALGDFVSRGLSGELRDALDRLVQAALAAAYAEGDAQRIQDLAPIVAISLRPGAIADTGFTGLLLPSIDRVGRFFPLCVGLEFSRVSGQLLQWPSTNMVRQIASLAQQAQLDRHGPDVLLQALPNAARWLELQSQAVPFTDVAPELHPPSLAHGSIQLAFQGPESRMVETDRARCQKLQHDAAALGAVLPIGNEPLIYFATRSALSWSSFAAIIDGRWMHWGWDFNLGAPSDVPGDEGETRPPVVCPASGTLD